VVKLLHDSIILYQHKELANYDFLLSRIVDKVLIAGHHLASFRDAKHYHYLCISYLVVLHLSIIPVHKITLRQILNSRRFKALPT